MTPSLPTGAMHHLRLTVTNVDRSRDFYTSVLGFNVVGELPPGVAGPAAAILLHNGSMLLAVSLAPQHPNREDRFDPNRVGLDHLSLGVANRGILEQAVTLFDERGIPHGDIVDYTDFQISVLPFRDPDDIQLELTAPHTP
jgi:glyoxylase I family protein